MGKRGKGCAGVGGCFAIFGALFVIVVFWLASQVQNSQSSWEERPEADAAFEEAIEIPLDEEMEGAETSLARNFYFIFDGSGSMKSEPGGGCRGDQTFGSKLEGAQWAVEEFLAKVPEDVHIGLYVFDRNGRREVVPLAAGNRQAFLNAVNNIHAGGGTPLAEGIQLGVDKLVEQYQRQLGYGEFRLVVVTDGRAGSIPSAARFAAQYGMPIYAIGLCIDEDHPLRRYAVSYRAADSFDDLAQGLEETLAELPAFDATEFDALELDAVEVTEP
ncbi:MAG: VWA domain-containing protein [bacterium]|nr:VWA domain-containing protein [bacterium]